MENGELIIEARVPFLVFFLLKNRKGKEKKGADCWLFLIKKKKNRGSS